MDGLRKIPTKNYVFLGVLILVTLLILYYFYMWVDVYKESKINIPIMDRYSNGSYVVKDKIKNCYLEVVTLSKKDFEGLEFVEDKKPEQMQLNFDMLNKESLKEVDDRMVIINNFLDNIEGK